MKKRGKIPKKRESREERSLAQKIRRKMLTQVKRDKTKYTRKKKHK